MKFEAMFQPVQIGTVSIPNRFVMCPMGNNFANTDGTMSERSIAYYTERAKGGFGLITLEATVVYKQAKGGPRKPCLYSDDTISSFRSVIESCHQAGAKVSIQLQHAGAEGNSSLTGYPLKSASAIPASCHSEIPESISTKELYELIECYGDAALRAKQAGADAVELHCAHGYLISSFISERTNKRQDEFGGCFENRMRLPRLIIENIRKKTQGELAVICRINGSDDIPGGQTPQDAASVASYLERECMADALHVSRAIHLHDEYMWAPSNLHNGFSSTILQEIKRAVHIPVITVGRHTEPQYAELMVREGAADLIAFGRQSIADPYLPSKAKTQQLDTLLPCIGCLQGCVPNMFQGKPITCLVNPMVGRESEFIPSASKKQVMVVGGGPGGLYAAYMCALRGHSVSLYEKTELLGGNMRIASYPPGKGCINSMICSYINNCKSAGVSIHLGTEVTPELIEAVQPDALILATGSQPLVPGIPGIEKAVFASDILDGKIKAGKNVLIVGGGMVGCETADFLGELGHNVSIIELRNELGSDMIAEHRKFLMAELETYHIQGITGAKVTEFFDDGVSYTLDDQTTRRLINIDTVILALGYRSCDTTLKTYAEEHVNEVYVIGDALKARRSLEATQEAFNTALTI